MTTLTSPRGHKVATLGAYRFRDRLPTATELAQPRNELRLVVAETVARIYLYDYIDSWGGYWGVSAAEVAAALDELDAGVTEIHLHINSGGGEVYEAIAMKNLLAAHPAKIISYVDGIAASAASFIAVASDETVMGENSELMIHDALAVAYGNAEAFRSYADDLDRVSDNIASIYAKKAGGDPAEWRQVMVDERFYSADDAVEAGLADRVDTDTSAGAGEETEISEGEDPTEIFEDGASTASNTAPAGGLPGAFLANHRKNQTAAIAVTA